MVNSHTHDFHARSIFFFFITFYNFSVDFFCESRLLFFSTKINFTEKDLSISILLIWNLTTIIPMSFLHLLLSRILKKGRFSQLWKILKRFCRQITYLVDHAIMENCLSSAPKFPPTFLLTAKISRNLRKKRANLLLRIRFESKIFF